MRFADRIAAYGALAGDDAVRAELRRPPRPAAPAHARPLRQAHRRGRVPSQLPRAHAGGDRAWRRRPVLARAAARRARRARGAELPAPPGRARQQLPADHDPRRGAGAAPRTGAGANGRDKAAAPHYDPRDVPIADKRGVTLGMGMTEKQGGSDVRANTTRADAARAATSTRSSGTSGSSPRRCATPSWCWRRRRAG